MEKAKLYFGHPINFYGTKKESELIRIIETAFPEFDIENPDQEKHAAGYQRYKIERGNGMAYFFEEVLPKMEECVFMSFEDGMFGKGVFREMEWLNNSKKMVWEITLRGIIIPINTPDQSKCLSVEETRNRVYGKK